MGRIKLPCKQIRVKVLQKYLIYACKMRGALIQRQDGVLEILYHLV